MNYSEKSKLINLHRKRKKEKLWDKGSVSAMVLIGKANNGTQLQGVGSTETKPLTHTKNDTKCVTTNMPSAASVQSINKCKGLLRNRKQGNTDNSDKTTVRTICNHATLQQQCSMQAINFCHMTDAMQKWETVCLMAFVGWYIYSAFTNHFQPSNNVNRKWNLLLERVCKHRYEIPSAFKIYLQADLQPFQDRIKRESHQ